MSFHRFAPALLLAFAACSEDPIDLTDTRDDTSIEDTSDDAEADTSDDAEADTSDEDTNTDASDFVADVSCATAIITVTSTDEVVVPPGTIVMLDGTQSYGDDGAPITEYRWELDMPVGSLALFLPSSHVATPSLHVGVPGVYTIRLYVGDALGTHSCVPAVFRFFVEPTEGCY